MPCCTGDCPEYPDDPQSSPVQCLLLAFLAEAQQTLFAYTVPSWLTPFTNPGIDKAFTSDKQELPDQNPRGEREAQSPEAGFVRVDDVS